MDTGWAEKWIQKNGVGLGFGFGFRCGGGGNRL